VPSEGETLDRAVRYREEGLWREERLSDDVRRHAARAGDALALVDGGLRLRWSELWERARQSAAALAAAGVGRGDVVSTQLPNGADCVVLHLAIELLGAVHNPLAVQFREHELDQISGLLGSRLVIHPGRRRDVDYAALHARSAAGRAGRALPVERVAGNLAAGPGKAPEACPARAREVAFILNTSGTVAIKGVMHSHEESLYSARAVTEITGLGPADRILCAIPMSWGGGLCWGVRFALHTGATLLSMERWEPRLAAELIDREGATFVYGPPTLARDLVSLADEWRPRGPLGMICAGAPIPRQMCLDARERLGLRLLPGYGQTEHLHSTLGRRDDSLEKLTGSDGRALPGVELVAVDESGKPCPPGAPGALLCRGPNVSLGYANQPDLTQEIFRPDGWQVTQDMGTFDEQGYLRVVGRIRDLIIRGGLNVSPREVEELLLRHPDVREVAVVGEPDPRYGERICAFIVARGEAVPGVAELASALTEMGVARYKHPERVVALDALPLTTTGKVRHAALRERLARERPSGD